MLASHFIKEMRNAGPKKHVKIELKEAKEVGMNKKFI